MKCLFGLFLAISISVSAQDPLAYKWFSATGKKSSFEQLVQATGKADIVFFGELHDDPIAHWMQLLLTQRIQQSTTGNFILGAEMFERHQQLAVNHYLSGEWTEEMLMDSSKMWSNFETDYLPLLRYAKEMKIPYVASNITRKYATMVFKKGLVSLDSLPTEEKSLMCPLPFPMDTTLSQYKELIKMGLEMHSNGLNFALSQAIKDATMAFSILEHWQAGKQFLHLNGSYHSDFHQSIVWYLLQKNPDLKIVTISTVNQDNVKKLESEYYNKADFILVVPNAMTRTM